jgi:hypothetical protein
LPIKDTKTDTASIHAPSEMSFVRGGPFYRFQQALRLIRPDRWNLGRRIIFLIAVGWLPLVLITAILNPDGLLSLMKEYRVHARLLIAVPVLLFGEYFMESRFRMVMRHIRQVDLLDAADLAYIDGVIATLVRVRDAFLPELVVLVVLIVHTAASYKGLVDSTPWLGHGTGADLHLTAF